MNQRDFARFGWASNLPEFSEARPEDVARSLQSFIDDASPEQIRAWLQSIPWLQDESRRVVEVDNRASTFAIVFWGSDLVRQNGAWSIQHASKYLKSSGVKDPKRLRTNGYRVLLTRGRDGVVVYVPPQPELDETYSFLLEAGFRELRAEV